MNESTRKIIIEYSVAAAIGFVFYMATFIGTGQILNNSIFLSILTSLIGALFFVGWYQLLVVDILGFENFSLQNLLQVFSRLCEAISKHLSQSIWMFLLKLLAVIFFGWLIGGVKAILRIRRSLNE